MNTSHQENASRCKPPSRGHVRVGARLAAALLTSAGVVTQAAATGDGLFEQVLVKEQVVVKPGAAKLQDAKTKPTLKKTVVRQNAAAVRIAGNANMIQRYTQLGKPMVYAEILFARGVCKLDQPTLAKIYPETLKVLDDVVKKLAAGQIQVRRGGAKSPDAETLLQQGLAAVFKKHLTADQYRLYEAESGRRLETRRKAAIRFMVDAIDRELLLSADQRSKLTETVTKNWDDGWTIYAQYALLGNLYFPPNIDQYVRPVLGEIQSKVWQTTQKVQIGGGFGGGIMLNGMEIPVAELLGIETKEEVAQREVAAQRRREAMEADQKARARMLQKAAEAKKAAARSLTSQFQSMVHDSMIADLHFARAACGLSKVEYQAVGKDALGKCDRLARDLFDEYDRTRGSPDLDAPAVDTTERIEKTLANVLKSHVSAVQWARYRDEFKKRLDGRRASSIEIILFTMDRHMLLSVRQRESIRRGLTDHWNPDWYLAVLESNPFDSERMLKIPDDIATPRLSPAQKQIWTKRATGVVYHYGAIDLARRLRFPRARDEDLEPKQVEVKESNP